VLKLVSAGYVSDDKMLVCVVKEANKPATRSIVRSKIGRVKILMETQTNNSYSLLIRQQAIAILICGLHQLP
jgi:hypothetical protein